MSITKTKNDKEIRKLTLLTWRYMQNTYRRTWNKRSKKAEKQRDNAKQTIEN